MIEKLTLDESIQLNKENPKAEDTSLRISEYRLVLTHRAWDGGHIELPLVIRLSVYPNESLSRVDAFEKLVADMRKHVGADF